MAKLTKLSEYRTKEPLFVNFANVLYMETDRDATVLYFSDEHKIFVGEKAEAIAKSLATGN